jgi:protein tyrosine/serine phosphatase
MHIRLLILGVLFLLSFTDSQIDLEGPKNFHICSDEMYRSAQPNKKQMKWLEDHGIKTVINLRNIIDDKQEIKSTSLIQVRVPMRAKKINYNDVVNSLRAMRAAEKPILVHCLHGSDRTGCMIAAYRMVMEDWPKEKAIAEFQKEKYGYNKKLFPNILVLLNELDIESLKKDVNNNFWSDN